MKRFAIAFMTLLFTLSIMCVESTAEAAKLSVQITLYDLESDDSNPAAVGRAELVPFERRASLFAFSPDPAVARISYDRDIFYLTRTGRNPQTGAVHFRVRHEQIIESRCTAMEIREYTMQLGESRELYSDRGQIRAIMKLTY